MYAVYAYMCVSTSEKALQIGDRVVYCVQGHMAYVDTYISPLERRRQERRRRRFTGRKGYVVVDEHNRVVEDSSRAQHNNEEADATRQQQQQQLLYERCGVIPKAHVGPQGFCHALVEGVLPDYAVLFALN